MYMTVIARALLYHTDLFQHFTNCAHTTGRVLQINCISEGKFVAYSFAHEFAANGALKDALVELQYTLKSIVVGPGRDHMPNGHTLVLKVDRDGPIFLVGLLHLAHHTLNIILVEKYTLIIVAHTLRVCSPPEEHLIAIHSRLFESNRELQRHSTRLFK